MKYCAYCGTQMDDSVQYCPNCGAKVNEQAASPEFEQQQTVFTAVPVPPVQNTNKHNGFAIAGLVLGIVSCFAWICCIHFITCILAVIFSAIALSQVKKSGEKGKGMAIAGMILGIVVFVIFVIGGLLLNLYGDIFLTEYMDEFYDYYDDYYDNFYYGYGDDYYDYDSEFNFSGELKEA